MPEAGCPRIGEVTLLAMVKNWPAFMCSLEDPEVTMSSMLSRDKLLSFWSFEIWGNTCEYTSQVDNREKPYFWNLWGFCYCNIGLRKLVNLTQPGRVNPPWAFTWENTYKTSPHLGGLPAKRDQDKNKLYIMVTPLHRVTSPTRGPPPPCK